MLGQFRDFLVGEIWVLAGNDRELLRRKVLDPMHRPKEKGTAHVNSYNNLTTWTDGVVSPLARRASRSYYVVIQVLSFIWRWRIATI